MFFTNYLTTNKIAKMLQLSQRRIQMKVKSGHFPNSIRCGCDSKSILIHPKDLKNEHNLHLVENIKDEELKKKLLEADKQ